MSKNRRLRRRVNLSVYLKAETLDPVTLLGRIVDISPAGFLLLTEKDLKEGQEMSVNITLPEKIGETSLINCIAKVVRVSRSVNESFSDVAFDIIYTTSATKIIIESIQQHWELHFPHAD